MAIHPLLSPAEPEEDPFAGINPGVIDFPDKKTPLEDTYHQTLDIEPDHAARVLDLSGKLNQPPAFIDQNMDAAKTAASVPSSQYFADITKKYPMTAQHLSEPGTMAAAKDDIDNLTETENQVKEYGFAASMWRSLNSGLSRLNANVARVPAVAYDIAALPQNLIAKAIGKSDYQVGSPEWLMDNPIAKYYDDASAAFKTPDMDKSIIGQIGEGDYAGAGRTLAAQFVANAPNQVFLLAAALSGYGGAGLVAAGATQGASVNKTARDAGAEPAAGALDSLYQGIFEAAFERMGTLGVLKSWETQITRSFGRDSARKVFKDFSKSITYSFAAEGNEEFWTQVAQDFSDFATGVNPNAMKGTLARAVDAGILGGVSGVGLTAPAGTGSGFVRLAESRRTEQAQKAYLAMGKGAEASKLRERLPAAHRAFVDSVTRGTPIETISIPADKFDTYFQSKQIDSAVMAEELEVSDQWPAARETGADVVIPLSVWAEKMVGTEHYEALKDDIRFHPEDQTANEQRESADLIEKQVFEEADQAAKENPKSQESRDFIYNDLKAQIQATGQVDTKVAESQAKIGAAVITNLAAKQGIDPREFYEKGPIRITDATNKKKPESLKQAAFHGTPHDVDKFSLKNIGTGEGHQAYGWGLYFAGNKEVAEYYRDAIQNTKYFDEVNAQMSVLVKTMVSMKSQANTENTLIRKGLRRHRNTTGLCRRNRKSPREKFTKSISQRMSPTSTTTNLFLINRNQLRQR